MRSGSVLLLAIPILAYGAGQPLEQLLSKVAGHAGTFRRTAPKILAREKLVQRSLVPPRRFHPRAGSAALQPTTPQYRTREVISEYGFGTLADAPGALHEFRQVISVDGRSLVNAEKARETLTAGLRSADDHVRKRMLENFEKHGLNGAATDFGQLLLLFTARRLGDYTFELGEEGRVGAAPARIIAFRQKSGDASLLILEKRKAIHQTLEGQLWVREEDGLPLRIVLISQCKDCQGGVRNETNVEYLVTDQGKLAPAIVVRKQTSGGRLMVEDSYEYSDYREFHTDSDIKFQP